MATTYVQLYSFGQFLRLINEHTGLKIVMPTFPIYAMFPVGVTCDISTLSITDTDRNDYQAYFTRIVIPKMNLLTNMVRTPYTGLTPHELCYPSVN